jgi:hypothetical protein
LKFKFFAISVRGLGSFPAQRAVLFERRAEDYLDMECLTIAGMPLFGYLKAAATKSA